MGDFIVCLVLLAVAMVSGDSMALVASRLFAIAGEVSFLADRK